MSSSAQIEGPATWPAHFPSMMQVRLEVEAMADSHIEALRSHIPESDLAGIYVKGSTLKHWDSPLDYVPELSDVDVHILFADEAARNKYFSDLETAASVIRMTEARFHQRVPTASHLPRLQLVIANDLFDREDFIPSPASTVETRFGRPYPAGDPHESARRNAAVKNLLEQREFVEKLPGRLIECAGKYNRTLLRDMSWRISPAGPRVLDLLGASFNEAWAANRTSIVKFLQDLGRGDLAAHYSQFYLGAWDFFLSRDTDQESARMAIIAGAAVLSESIAIGMAAAQSTAEIQVRQEPVA